MSHLLLCLALGILLGLFFELSRRALKKYAPTQGKTESAEQQKRAVRIIPLDGVFAIQDVKTLRCMDHSGNFHLDPVREDAMMSTAMGSMALVVFDLELYAQQTAIRRGFKIVK
jgi:hypothetical protein